MFTYEVLSDNTAAVEDVGIASQWAVGASPSRDAQQNSRTLSFGNNGLATVLPIDRPAHSVKTQLGKIPDDSPFLE